MHSQKGLEYYNAERYPEAVREMLAAYQAVPDAALLYNIARIYQTMEETDLAVEYFYRFVKSTDADPDTVQKALDYLAELRAQPTVKVESPEVAPAPAPAAVVQQPVEPLVAAPDPVPTRRLAALPLAVGVGGLATGVVAGVLAASARATYLDTELDYAERLLAQERGRGMALVSDVGWTLTAVGVGWHFLGRPTGAQVSFGGRW